MHPRLSALVVFLVCAAAAAPFIFKGVRDGLIRQRIDYGPKSRLAVNGDASLIGWLFVSAGCLPDRWLSSCGSRVAFASMTRSFE